MTTAKKLMTADELLAMPDDGNRHELVRGELIEMPPPGIMHVIITGRIGYRFSHFIEENGLPFVYGPEAAAFTERGRTRCGRPTLGSYPWSVLAGQSRSGGTSSA